MEAKKHTLSLTTFRYTFFSFFFQRKIYFWNFVLKFTLDLWGGFTKKPSLFLGLHENIFNFLKRRFVIFNFDLLSSSKLLGLNQDFPLSIPYKIVIIILFLA